MRLNPETALKYPINLLTRSTGVEAAIEKYKEVSNPNSDAFTASKKAQIGLAAFSLLSQYMYPSANRIIRENNISSIITGTDAEKRVRALSTVTFMFGALADFTITQVPAIWIDAVLNHQSELTGSALLAKVLLNASMHVGLDLAQSALDRIKGAPTLVRV